MLFQNERVTATPNASVSCRLPSPSIAPRGSLQTSAKLMMCALLVASTAAHAAGPKPVNLGMSKFFVILTETGIADVSASAVTGNVGTSPITGAADLLSCTEVTGHILSVDAAGPQPCGQVKPAALSRSIGAMETAYTDAAGRTPDVNELAAGNIGGLTIKPGTYNWTSNVLIGSDVTLKGTSKDTWIFQVAQDVNLANATAIHLAGGAKAKNIFWQVAGAVTMGTTSHFEGIVLSKTMIAMKTGASINGRLYAQTAVTLEMNKVTKPAG